ncbi:MmcQ/YjbR family DNA-binding protein [Fulvivirgaceae bacterium BMA10]|uniref:MmcQ/YjbR family DNA-binding protein n=1 Tax=Splendidivirga corallicola TaxID=3051826 RepID=A0ABT8KSD2_9BACT|nr:MmcQ/YjbR family DNA-binding protein [Fulvivirgaceae bacterium BMA10]
MFIEDLQEICHKLPGVTEDIKWENHLCFCVEKKMFLILGLDEAPTTASFKVTEEDFEALSTWSGFKPAPYMARNKWIWTDDIGRLSKKQWEQYAYQSYHLIASKLPIKTRKQLGIYES